MAASGTSVMKLLAPSGSFSVFFYELFSENPSQMAYANG